MIVTLCGSARFEDHFKTWNEALTMAGHTVFTLTRYPSEKGAKLWYTDAQKLALDEAHKRKINASEAVLVLNIFGYMGPSTLSEVEHAKARGKQLFALESWGKGNGICGMHFGHVQEARRRIIPEGYAGSPIDTTSNSGFRYAYDLLDDVVTHERSYELVRMVQACDERLRTDGVPVVQAPGVPPEEGHPDQTIMETETQRGNCLQATLAAILGRPLDTVPHFVALHPEGGEWWERMACWLYEQGYLLRYPPTDPVLGEPLPLCGLGGWSERGFPHIVVGDTATGQMVHDPHPSRAGLTKVDYTVLLYRRTDGVPGTLKESDRG